MTDHKQVAFRLNDNTHTQVDEGLYEFLCLLRDLGVNTQYSCQGGMFSAYVVGSAETFGPVIDRLQSIKQRHYVLQKIFEYQAEFTVCHQDTVARRISDDEPYEWFKWELDDHFRFGLRYVLRWKPKATPLFVEALQELINQPKENSHV